MQRIHLQIFQALRLNGGYGLQHLLRDTREVVGNCLDMNRYVPLGTTIACVCFARHPLVLYGVLYQAIFFICQM